MQDEGWEIAGNIDVKYHDSPTNREYMYIPLKRKL